jgi:hypothetical protein
VKGPTSEREREVVVDEGLVSRSRSIYTSATYPSISDGAIESRMT